MLARVAGVDGVIHLAPGLSNGDTLVFRDEAGTPLRVLLEDGSLTLDETLALAISLGRTIANVHRAGVVHKDINPSNILVGGCDLHTTLIDFNIASSSTEERAAFTHANLINGTLAYMAPEQTGRTGRTVDQRTDLYALGATLYEMVVGHRPFESDDPLHLLRDQLISKPPVPTLLDPTIPPALSEIILRLLEKEPDDRYQSADGLVHDLQCVKQAAARGETARFTLGECDFPLRICAPSRPIGRDAEIAILNAGVEQVVAGQGLTLLVSGPAGVGKTTLIDEMRSMVTAHGGWYVGGKFDQYRHDAPSAVMQALRSLGRILLAEPEATAAAHRQCILGAVGANAGLGPTRLPEFELLLGELPQVVVADTLELESRAIQCTIDLLRGIASPQHPVVMVLDDLQWASAMSLRLLDALVVAATPVPGLMIVGAYREAEVDGDHPLSSMLSQWQELGVAPRHVHLENLRPRHIDTLVGAMLRLAPDEARSLGQTLNLRTNGNPYDTVELINALRAEGLLEPQAGGWLWDTGAIHRHVGDASVMDLLARRIDKLPAEAHALLEIVACLGGGVRPGVLATASGLTQNKVEHLLAPALDEGLLVVEPGAEELLRFRHDRVQQAVFAGLGSDRRRALHLTLARRFAVEPGLTSLCAEQYLPAAEAITDEVERRSVAARFTAAARVVRMCNTGAAERFLSAAIQLIKSLNDGRDADLLLTLKMDLHEALYGLGRLPEADRLYADIQSNCTDAVRLVDVTGVQIYSLTNRGRHARAMSLGLALLARLGRTRPDDMRDALSAGMTRLNSWLSGTEMAADLTRPEVTDELVLARAKIIIKTGAAAYLCDPTIFAWLILEAHRSWLLDGPCVPLMSSAGAAPFLLVGAPQDYRGAYAAGRHFLTVGAARGFEPATSLARYVFAVSSLHWFEPVENAVPHLEQARKQLTQTGDLHFAACTYLASDALLDSAPTLNGFASEVESGLAYAARSNNGDFRMRTLPRRQLLRALRGETRDFGSFDDGDFDDAAHEAAVHGPSTASSMYHVFRALAAALFDDMPLLLKQTALAMPVLPMGPGYYITAIAHFLRAVAMAHEARCRSGDERTRALDELDEERTWLAKRAEDAPCNFGHLLLLVDAERAWAVGELWTACATFDAAIDQAVQRPRPWHQAFITERAGAFHLANGMESSGRPLLERARALYRTWGAVGKVEQLDARHAFLSDGVPREALAQGGGEIFADVMDTIAVMRASKALSSETNLNKLTARITGLLSALTGATEVDLLGRSDGNETWFLSEPSEATGERLSAEQAADAGRIPLSVLRYVERTQECLLVDDALCDDRFAGESCWAGSNHCSLLVVPILNQGQLHSMLVLQNRLQRAAFSRDRLDAVMLIAGQLSVSLQNALLHASLERKVADRTSALEEANLRLALLSQTDALTGLANRRHFDQVLEVECLRANRTGTPIGLVMIDVDHFKQYNDHYGHQSGDTCLRTVASALKASMRSSADLIARYGGEEFVLLLPNADLAGARAAAERVRAAVEAMQEPHAGAAPRNIVTISAGFSAFSPIEGDSASDCLQEADAALYAAKREGRNCAQGPEVDEPQDAIWSVGYVE